MFQISFKTQTKTLGEVLLALHAFRIEDLDVRPVVRAGANGKAGGKTAVETVVETMRSAKQPLQSKAVADVLEAAGFRRGGASTHLKTALEKKLIRKTARGYVSAGGGK